MFEMKESNETTVNIEVNSCLAIPKKQVEAPEDGRTIHLGNLPVVVKEEKLLTIFKSFGTIESIYIHRDLDDPCLALTYGYLVFSNEASARKVLAWKDPIIVNGINLIISQPRKKAWSSDQVKNKHLQHYEEDNFREARKIPNRGKLLKSSPWMLLSHRSVNLAPWDSTHCSTAFQENYNLDISAGSTNPFKHKNAYNDYDPSRISELFKPHQNSSHSNKFTSDILTACAADYSDGEAFDGYNAIGGGRVAFVSDLPQNWDAQDLYNDLQKLVYCVSATLIFYQRGKRGLQEGIVQFECPLTSNLIQEIHRSVAYHVWPKASGEIDDVEKILDTSSEVVSSYYLGKNSGMRTVNEFESSPLFTPMETETPQTDCESPEFIFNTQAGLHDFNYKKGPFSHDSRTRENHIPRIDEKDKSTLVKNSFAGASIGLEPTDNKVISTLANDLSTFVHHTPKKSCRIKEKEESLPKPSTHEARYCQQGYYLTSSLLTPSYASAINESTYGHLRLTLPPGYKLSQTLVIDNLDNEVVHDVSQIKKLVQPFGDVLEIDYMPLLPSVSRAYVCFRAPEEAAFAMSRLPAVKIGRCFLQVRLA